jgi:hypothetical protein
MQSGGVSGVGSCSTTCARPSLHLRSCSRSGTGCVSVFAAGDSGANRAVRENSCRASAPKPNERYSVNGVLKPLVVLLALGFGAGAIGARDPSAPLGENLLSAIVSIAVGIILFEAGLALNVRKLTGSVRRVVLRLV